jgi:hypothetical protein
MKFTTALLFTLLGSFVSAGNIRNHYKQNCKGGYKTCNNIGPRTCCSALHNNGTAGGQSANFTSIPAGAKVIAWNRGNGKTCGSKKDTINAGSDGHQCLNDAKSGHFAGTSFKKQAGKRMRMMGRDDGDDDCTNDAKVDAIVLNDGHMFNVSRMSDELMGQLDELAENGALFKDLPAPFAKFEVDKDGIEERLADM